MKREIDLLHGIQFSDLEREAVIDVITANRVYRVEHLGGGEALISGHPAYCPEPVTARVGSCSADFSEVVPDRIVPGYCLNVYCQDDRYFRTSPIVKLQVH